MNNCFECVCVKEGRIVKVMSGPNQIPPSLPLSVPSASNLTTTKTDCLASVKCCTTPGITKQILPFLPPSLPPSLPPFLLSLPQYLELDHDQNGLLSKRELLHYAGYFQQTRLTPVFVDRIFEESITYRLPVPPAAAGGGEGEEGGEGGGMSEAEMVSVVGGRERGREGGCCIYACPFSSHFLFSVSSFVLLLPPSPPSLSPSPPSFSNQDYKVFLDFILAMENRASPPALRWFFRMLDIEKKHVVSPFAVRFFFREVVRALQEAGFEAPLVNDVTTEIFDMARPVNPTRGITLEDLLNCGVGSIVVSMLTDVQSFLNYDQREHSAAAAAAGAAARLEEEELQAQMMLAQAQAEAEGEGKEEGEEGVEEGGVRINIDVPRDAAALGEEEEDDEEGEVDQEQEQEDDEDEEEGALHPEALALAQAKAEWEEEGAGEEEEELEEEEEEGEKRMNGGIHLPGEAHLDAKDGGDEEGEEGEEAGNAIFVTEGERHQGSFEGEEEEEEEEEE